MSKIACLTMIKRFIQNVIINEFLKLNKRKEKKANRVKKTWNIVKILNQEIIDQKKWRY